VYDTGPGNGQQAEAAWHMVDGTIQPMIAARGLKPYLIVASHADLDHAGGLARLRDIYPQADIIASQAEKTPGISLCKAPASWRAGGLEFNILHPSKGLPYLGNDSSCVISVNGLGLGLLLSGDISRAVEQRLAGRTLGKHALLTVPHHGSSTSSSQALIDAVMPELVMISAAYKNRFNFPREDVMTRYQNSNTQILNTAKCGGIRITTGEGQQPHVETARVTRSAIWRWPAGPGCP
jgi:competence protein ComEC